MPSTTRRTPAARERRRGVEQRVFEAVERLLEAGASYTDLGVQRIAEEAGIGRSTFYLHFADKNDLLLRLARTATAELFDVAGAWVDSGDADADDALTATMGSIIEHRRSHAAALRALDEVSSYDDEVAGFWGDLVDAFADRLEQRLRRDRAAGAAVPDAELAAVARILVWSVERSVARHVADPRGVSDADMAAALAHTVRRTAYTG